MGLQRVAEVAAPRLGIPARRRWCHRLTGPMARLDLRGTERLCSTLAAYWVFTPLRNLFSLVHHERVRIGWAECPSDSTCLCDAFRSHEAARAE